MLNKLRAWLNLSGDKPLEMPLEQEIGSLKARLRLVEAGLKESRRREEALRQGLNSLGVPGGARSLWEEVFGHKSGL